MEQNLPDQSKSEFGFTSICSSPIMRQENYLSTDWLGKNNDVIEEDLNTPPQSPDETALHEETPDKDIGVSSVRMFSVQQLGLALNLQEGQPQQFAEVSSLKFSKTHLDQAKIDFDINAEISFTVQREALPHFPWSIFDTAIIPVTDEHAKHLRSQEKDKFVIKNEGTYQQFADNWTIDHVINEQWRDYFSIVRTNYLTIDKNSKNDAKIETMAEQLCHYFGFTVSRYYTLHQYPTFPVHVKADAPIEVKQDVVAGHWRINPDGNMVCFFAEDSPMIDLLYRIIKADGWTPNASRVFVPSFIAECSSGGTGTNEVFKLLIELAIVRDIERRLFKTNRRYTLGACCLGLNWHFYVLQDSESPDFVYKAHRIYTHRLTKSYLSWLQLGVILQRLAAYNLSCTRRLEIISESEQTELIDEIKQWAVDEKPKPSNRSKNQAVNSPSTASRSNPKSAPNNNDVEETKRRICLEVKDAVITRELYSGPSTRVCLAVTSGGYEVAVKLIKSQSEALYEATMLHKLQGRYVVKLLRFDAKNEARLIMEKLNPLPEFTTRSQLQMFIWELLQALLHVHSHYCVHGDIKHANVMLSASNHVKLIDFAFATTLYPGQTLKYKFGGTYVYMSPERLDGDFESNKVDIFAAGLVCAEKMYNTRIDSFAAREKLIERVNNSECTGLATPKLVDLVRTMLEEDPDERPSAEVCLEHPYFDDINVTMDESD